MKTLTLKNGIKIPIMGFGTWQLTGEIAKNAVKKALEVGYRHIDTAIMYGNQPMIAEAIAESGIDRRDLFITSKIPPSELSREDVAAAGKQILTELNTDYLDLLLVHWPNPAIPLSETLNAMQDLLDREMIRAIGVSNFSTGLLEDDLKTDVVITDNQVEFHPSLNQKRLKQFCDEHDIIVTAYSPIGQGGDLSIGLIQRLAIKYDRSPSQVILNWIISKNMVAIPRSANPIHIEDNFHALDWQLSPEDIEAIDNIGGHNRLVGAGFFNRQE